MSTPASRLIVRSAVRRRILEVAAEWHIRRRRVPRDLIDTLAADFEKQIAARVCGLLNSAPPPLA